MTLTKRLAFLRRRLHVPSRKLSTVTSSDLDYFASILPPSAVLSTLSSPPAQPHELDVFNHSWIGRYHGVATTVLRPSTTAQISQILAHCNTRRIGVVPQGGNTGVVGGGVATSSHELLLSLGRMNQVRTFNPVSGILVADAGCVLQSLTDYLLPHGYIMPIDLGGKGSCQIGGNVSTNAGGVHVLRHGSLHGNVLGLEVVLADGTVLDQLSTLRKDNTGYDIKQLFIGAEGTLGVVTGVSILTPPKPQSTNAVLLALPSFKSVLPLFALAKRQLSEILSAFEYIDRSSYDLALKHGHGVQLRQNDDTVKDAQCFVLIETSGSHEEHDAQKLDDFLQSLLDTSDRDSEPLITTGILAQTPAQFDALWAMRDGIGPATVKEGKAYKYDFSVPLPVFGDVVDILREHLGSKGLLGDHAVKHVCGFGHVGDGNLHINVVASPESGLEVPDALEPFVYELVASYRGSISAEHGIGVLRKNMLRYSKSDASIALMKRIKAVFDPNGIMNPGKIFA